jgi:hypothetical protein
MNRQICLTALLSLPKQQRLRMVQRLQQSDQQAAEGQPLTDLMSAEEIGRYKTILDNKKATSKDG